MKTKYYETGWPWWQHYETTYDDNGRKCRVKMWKQANEGSTEYEAHRNFILVGEENVPARTVCSGIAPYTIEYDYYPNASLQHAKVQTTYGTIEVNYDEDGLLTTLKKTVNKKTTTFNFSYKDKEKIKKDGFHVDRCGYIGCLASSLQNKYSAFYIDSTGGFQLFDKITDQERFAEFEKDGVIVKIDGEIKQKAVTREPTEEEKIAAFSLLDNKESTSDTTICWGRLEKTDNKNRLIGSDIKVLENGLIAVAKMYSHEFWERGDASWTIRGNGEQWTYEVDGAIVDIQEKKVIKRANFSSVVRDSYDGSKDTYHYIDRNSLIRIEDNNVTFIMGDKYHNICDRTIDVSKLSAAPKTSVIKRALDASSSR